MSLARPLARPSARPPARRLAGAAAALSLSLAAGCAAAPRSPLDLRDAAHPSPLATLVWVGRGEAERLEGGTWRRTPAFDYEFTVLQQRYADHWESVKTLRRLHPAYDGSAGPREQVMGFRLDYGPAVDGQVTSRVRSTLGEGPGRTDAEFRRAVLEIAADVSRFAPFDTYRITQDYRYEEGRLLETVELLDHDGPVEKPWVRNHEEAALFGARAFPAPPTVMGGAP